jgi:hypothetical protein
MQKCISKQLISTSNSIIVKFSPEFLLSRNKKQQLQERFVFKGGMKRDNRKYVQLALKAGVSYKPKIFKKSS